MGDRQIEGPAWIQPGMADNVVALALGYGRTKAGRVGTGTGYNAYALRSSQSPWRLTGGRVTDTGRRHQLATTQNHWAMEGRPIIREANLQQYRKHPHFATGMNAPEPPKPRPMTRNEVRSTTPRATPAMYGFASFSSREFMFGPSISKR